jgi:bifunctional ADP-heptose synthase (sugar kinase/adenylyltransferase)
VLCWPRTRMRPNAAIAKAVAAFAGKRVLVAGDLMLDRYWSGDVDRISPEAPVPVVRKVSAFGVPGGAANTACNVAALDARVVLFGVTGQDEAGVELRAMLSKRGIDCAQIPIAAGRSSASTRKIPRRSMADWAML